MPAGVDVTVPVPAPLVETLKVLPGGRFEKFAPTVFALSTVIRQLAAVPEQSPDQPVNIESVLGVAERTTVLPEAKSVAQVAPQLIPAGVDEITPVPSPVLLVVTLKTGPDAQCHPFMRSASVGTGKKAQSEGRARVREWLGHKGATPFCRFFRRGSETEGQLYCVTSQNKRIDVPVVRSFGFRSSWEA